MSVTPIGLLYSTEGMQVHPFLYNKARNNIEALGLCAVLPLSTSSMFVTSKA